MADITSKDRLMQAIRLLIRAELPQLTYLGIYEYVIRATDGTTVDCIPAAGNTKLPQITKVPLRCSTLGSVTKPTVGAFCLVQFVNGDPTRPICTSADPTPETATVNATSHVGIGVNAGSGLAAARVTDTILAAGVFAGSITSGSAKTTIG